MRHVSASVNGLRRKKLRGQSSRTDPAALHVKDMLRTGKSIGYRLFFETRQSTCPCSKSPLQDSRRPCTLSEDTKAYRPPSLSFKHAFHFESSAKIRMVPERRCLPPHPVRVRNSKRDG